LREHRVSELQLICEDFHHDEKKEEDWPFTKAEATASKCPFKPHGATVSKCPFKPQAGQLTQESSNTK